MVFYNMKLLILYNFKYTAPSSFCLISLSVKHIKFFLKKEAFYFTVVHYFTIESNNYNNRAMSLAGVRYFILKLVRKGSGKVILNNIFTILLSLPFIHIAS